MIEQLARAAATDFRAATTCDVEAGLADLHVRRVQHQRRTRLGLVAAVVLALGLGGIGGAVLAHRDDKYVPPTHPAPHRNHAQPYCPPDVRVTCLGHNTYRYPLVRPVDWKIPTNFGVGSSTVTPFAVESYRDDGHPGQSGVTVMERARAWSPDGKGPAAGVADTPQALVHWVASRPFLTTGPVRTTTLDGHRAWQVRATLAPHVPPGPANWNGPRCYAVVSQPVSERDMSCLHGDFVSEYTAIRLPRAGTTLVWSWSVGPNPRLGQLAKLFQGLSWPTH